MKKLTSTIVLALLAASTCSALVAQQPEAAKGGGERVERGSGQGFGRPEGRGGPPAEFGPGRGPGAMLQALPLMIALDADKDGTISEVEIKNAVAALQALDKNADGKLTEDELRPDMRQWMAGGVNGRGGPMGLPGFRGWPGGPGMAGDPDEAATRIMEFDKNNDGKLAPDEMPETMRPRTQLADADGDGFVTKAELVQMIEMAAADAGTSEGGSEGRGQPEGFFGSPEAMINRTFADSDTDQDGKLSETEVPDRLRERFGVIDTNNDKMIDKQELGVAMARMMGRGGPGGPGQPGGPGPREGRPRGAGSSRPNRPNSE